MGKRVPLHGGGATECYKKARTGDETGDNLQEGNARQLILQWGGGRDQVLTSKTRKKKYLSFRRDNNTSPGVKAKGMSPFRFGRKAYVEEGVKKEKKDREYAR